MVRLFEHTRNEEGCSADRFDAPEVFRRARNWIQEIGDRPFFALLHTYHPHDRCPVDWKLGEPAADPGADDRRVLAEYYDRLIAETDRYVGELLDELSARGRNEDTIVAVTSDHGEAFWEHGFSGHGCNRLPYEEVSRIPLMIRVPGRLPARVSTPVSLSDLAPTLLELAGISAAELNRWTRAPWMAGRVLPALGLAETGSTDAVYVHCGELLAVREGNHKLVTSRGTAGDAELFDIDHDPAETRNLAAERPQVYARLREWANRYWRETPTGLADETPSMDQKTKEQLRALGYLE